MPWALGTAVNSHPSSSQLLKISRRARAKVARGRWDELQPFIAHYQRPACESTGTTGNWNAAIGSSQGWSEWSVDLSAYAGQQVEVSIAYVSDWAILPGSPNRCAWHAEPPLRRPL